MSQWIQFKNPSETLQALRELVESNSIFSTKEVLQETQIAMSDRNLNKNACYITAESNDLVKAILSSDPLREHHIVEELPSNNSNSHQAAINAKVVKKRQANNSK